MHVKGWNSSIISVTILFIKKYSLVQYGTVRLVRRTENEKYGTVRTFGWYCYSLVSTLTQVTMLNLNLV